MYIWILIVWAISLSILGLQLQKEGENFSDLDSTEVTVALVGAPFFAAVAVITFIMKTAWYGLTYFGPEQRHKRALLKAERERQLWEAQNGMKYEDLDEIIALGHEYGGIKYEEPSYEERPY